MVHKEEYYWVVMKPEAETFSLGKRVIMAKLIWEDGLVEWLLPGSLALWKPDKDFMVLEKVSEHQGLVLPDCCVVAPYSPGEYQKEDGSVLPPNDAYDALERLVNGRDAEAKRELARQADAEEEYRDALDRLDRACRARAFKVTQEKLARDLNDAPEKPPMGVQTRSESWDALERIIGREGVSAGFADEFDDLCESYQTFLKEEKEGN